MPDGTGSDAGQLDPAPTLAPASSLASIPFGGASATLARDRLMQLGDLTPATWPIWKAALPSALEPLAQVAAVGFYLDGTFKQPEYTIAKLEETLENPVEAARFSKWSRIASTLKNVVMTYGGPRASAAVDL
ncbi:hypothetical protein DMC30DRAFT_419258, partial [Rhodotorula diobovata]